MSTLTIKDLPRNEEMDSNDMTAIEGGITFPANVPVVTAKLIAPPQPVTTPSGSYSWNEGGGGDIKFYNGEPYGGEDLHQP